MQIIHYLNAFLLAFFTSVIAVPLLRQWALKSGKLDEPDERKVHKNAMPRLGGVAIIFSFLISVLVFFEITSELKGLLVGVLIVFAVGLLDDLVGLTPKQKFAGQISAAVLTMFLSGLFIEDLGNLLGFGNILLPFWLSCLFTVFAVVGVTNAINMIDGLDGLAGGVSVIALLAFVILLFGSGNYQWMAIAIVLGGSLFGFLKHNSYPANIFMGDAGSLSLGFLLAFLAVAMTQDISSAISPSVPVLILGLPIIDTLKVMVRRKVKGKSPFDPDMTHVHHSFLGLGLDHRYTVLLIYSFTFFWSIFAIYFQEGPGYFLCAVYLVSIAVVYWLVRYMKRHPRSLDLFDKDSSRSLKESNLFAYVRRVTCRMTPILLVLALTYLLMAMAVSAGIEAEYTRLALLAFVAGCVLAILPSERRRRYIFIYYVGAALLLVLLTERQLHLPNEYPLDYHFVSNSLFFVLAIIVCMKIIFRKEDVVYLTSPLDYLFLAMIVAMVAIPGEMVITHRIPSIILKSIFLIMAMKMINTETRFYTKAVFVGLQLTLLFVFVRNSGWF